MHRLALAGFVLLASPAAFAQTTWYVDDDGAAPGTGTLVDPYTSIGYAIAQASTLTGDRIEVQPGTYLDELVDFLGKDVDVEGVGGAAATTIVARPEFTQTYTAVRFAGGEGAGARLAGFTIRGGTGEPSTLVTTSSLPTGGGIFCAQADPTLTDLVVRDNTYAFHGAGAFFFESSATLTDCQFIDNGSYTDFSGGAGLAAFDSNLILTDVTFDGNRTDWFGGGLWIEGGSTQFVDCTIEDNGTSYGFGSGCYAKNADLSFLRTEFLFNFGGDSGGGLYATGCTTEIEDCLFLTNRSGPDPYPGGAIFESGGSLTIRDSVFRDNYGQFGGAIHTMGTALIEDSLFEDNADTGLGLYSSHGGALAGNSATVVRRSLFLGNTSYDTYTDGGGAVYGPVLLEKCTLVGNSTAAGLGGAARYATLVDCIVWGNIGDAAVPTVDNLVDCSATYSLVQGGWPGTGNIDGDPLFWDQAQGDLHLLPGSPAIDKGDPLSPLDPDGTRADMGALPFDSSYCGPGCDGPIGTSYCVATANSSGAPASLRALGSLDLATNLVLLFAEQLPVGQAGYCLMSDTQGFTPMLGGGQGNLCLGAPLIRLVDQVLVSTGAGSASRQLDVQNLPQQTVFLPGSSWSFQFWFRDVNPGQTSNTTQGLEIVWR